jgi:bifunctional polynucleotide phosphatase/kinase
MSIKRPPPPDERAISPPPIKRKIESTTTSSAISSFFKPTSQKPPDKTSWRIINDSLIIGQHTPSPAPSKSTSTPQARPHPVKIAAFDLDDTLISPTGAKFARGSNAWRWWHPSVPGRLRDLHSQGYLVAILTNQGGIALKDKNPKKVATKEMASLANFKSQLGNVLEVLALNINVYGATGKDEYRKPRAGMWTALLADHGLEGNGSVDMDGSFYVGDAAGREKTDKRQKADWASSDRDLAANIGVRFQTPEEFFLGEDVEPYTPAFDPSAYLSGDALELATVKFEKRHERELVIFCGSPGAGKSTFYWRVLEPLGYVRVNQDILKSRDKCLKVAERELAEERRSVVVDNTNADVRARAYWTALAKKLDVPVRCVHFTTPTRLAEHNDSVRALNGELMNPEKREILPGIAFKSFLQRYEKPDVAEGFEDITTVDFSWHGTDEQKEIWKRYWVSKFST